MAGVAGQAVAGGQGGVEIVLRAREVWQVAWGRGFSFEFTVTRTRLPEVRLGFFFSLEPWGKLRLGVGFRHTRGAANEFKDLLNHCLLQPPQT